MLLPVCAPFNFTLAPLHTGGKVFSTMAASSSMEAGGPGEQAEEPVVADAAAAAAASESEVRGMVCMSNVSIDRATHVTRG